MCLSVVNCYITGRVLDFRTPSSHIARKWFPQLTVSPLWRCSHGRISAYLGHDSTWSTIYHSGHQRSLVCNFIGFPTTAQTSTASNLPVSSVGVYNGPPNFMFLVVRPLLYLVHLCITVVHLFILTYLDRSGLYSKLYLSENSVRSVLVFKGDSHSVMFVPLKMVRNGMFFTVFIVYLNKFSQMTYLIWFIL